MPIPIDPGTRDTPPTVAEAEGELHVRLARGTVIRSAPDAAAPTVTIVAEDRLLPVLEQKAADADDSRWFLVDGRGELWPQGEGWVRTDPARSFRLLTPPLGPKPSVAADPERLASLRTFLSGGGREHDCGPYELWTDVTEERLVSALCDLASSLDVEYQRRLGISPIGPARESVVLFARLQEYSRWERSQEGSRFGYAGHAAASEGLAVLHAERPADDAVATAIHELTHLVNRRALGSPLPRWLSEGLADALGDSATTRGFLPLQGATGVEGELQRLRSVLRSGAELPTLAQLVSKNAASFDHAETGPVYDYEMSALFVRFLLTQPELRPRFRSFLEALANGGRWSPQLLWDHLDQTPETLDLSFRSWLLAV